MIVTLLVPHLLAIAIKVTKEKKSFIKKTPNIFVMQNTAHMSRLATNVKVHYKKQLKFKDVFLLFYHFNKFWKCVRPENFVFQSPRASNSEGLLNCLRKVENCASLSPKITSLFISCLFNPVKTFLATSGLSY